MQRETSPTAAVIGSQSVTSAERGGHDDLTGYDAGKMVKARKIHALVDTQGLPLRIVILYAAHLIEAALAKVPSLRIENTATT
jgi:hypothetical protein